VRDISPWGARLLVASNKVHVGDSVRVALYFEGAPTPDVVARAHLLRVSEAESAGIWKCEVAVRFDSQVALAGHALS